MSTKEISGYIHRNSRNRYARRPDRLPWRFRTVKEKLQIVAETRVPGVSVFEVARRHEVNANQIFAWRRQQDQGVLSQRILGLV